MQRNDDGDPLMLGEETNEGLLNIDSEDKLFHRSNDDHKEEEVEEEIRPCEINMISDKGKA